MSWSVSGTGTPDMVKAQMAEQFKHPLAEPPAGIADEGERETVRLVSQTIDQSLGTFGPDRKVAVSAYGHMGTGYQEVTLTIKPTA